MGWSEELNSQDMLPQILERMVDRDPGRPFISTVAGETANWGELHSLASEWAARFLSLGVKKGDIVATLLDAGIDALAIWLGLVRIGATDAATNAEFRGRILAYAINNCRPSLIVTTQTYLPFLEAVAKELTTVRQVLVLGRNDGTGETETSLPGVTFADSVPIDAASPKRHLVMPRWHDIACITYTSGTTGPSKAVLLPWAQLNCINLGTFPYEDLSASDVFYSVTSHAHFGSKAIPYLAAMVGGQVAMRPRFSLNSFWEDVARFGITTASLVGTMADMLMRSLDSPQGKTSLRNLFMAPLGPSYGHFSERFGTRICTAYNSTEGGLAICSGWNPSDERTSGRLRQGYPGFEVRLVDEHDFEVPDGTPGECIVRSAVPWTMNDGYLHNPEATAAAWRNGWFHTGDALVRTADGDYAFVDRLKDVIRRRGENISSYEVETDVLMNSAIIECAAVAVAAETSEDEILLFAVKSADSSVTEVDLCTELQGRMARFMVPRYIEFVESLPKTPATQRIIKAELRQRGVGPRTWDNELQCYADHLPGPN